MGISLLSFYFTIEKNNLSVILFCNVDFDFKACGMLQWRVTQRLSIRFPMT
jgi:hypothetical protein